jgi:hypothetical protein
VNGLELEQWLFENYSRRATTGERRMATWYRGNKWHFLPGEPGHSWNSPGPDGIAWRDDGNGGIEVDIVDNKALTHPRVPARGRLIRGVSALEPAALSGTLGRVLHALHHDAALKTLPQATKLRQTLMQAWQAMATGTPLPAGVRRVVTNANGRSTGISPRLRQQGVGFRNIAAATRPVYRRRPPARRLTAGKPLVVRRK